MTLGSDDSSAYQLPSCRRVGRRQFHISYTSPRSTRRTCNDNALRVAPPTHNIIT